MFKEIFTRLIRHLPSRLVHRDPLPGAQQTVNTVVPPSLSAHCLKMAVMPEEELWKTFDTHPEGLNQAEVESAREQHGENKLPAQQPSPWWVHLWVCYRNPFNILLTILGAISYATEDLFAAGVIALMVAISTLLNFIQEARSTKAADALKAMVSNTATVLRVINDKGENGWLEIDPPVLVQRDANSTVRFPHASATHYRQILNASCSVAFLVLHRARYKTGGKGFLCSAPRETRHVG